jgi:hypothetical protein
MIETPNCVSRRTGCFAQRSTHRNLHTGGCIINQIDHPWCCVNYELKFSR